MKRSEAEKRIGEKFSVWTSLNGEYIGTLVRVVPNRPWRGVVQINAVLRMPQLVMFGTDTRKLPWAAGSEREVGGVNLSPWTQPVPTYEESLGAMFDRDLALFTDWQKRIETGASPQADAPLVRTYLEVLRTRVAPMIKRTV